MAQTVLEISTKTSDNKNTEGSYFSQVFGEPIKVSAGSSIDFLNGFLDLGKSSIDDYIYIPEKFQLGINFYRYEYDHPQIPTTQGTDSKPHAKRYIYWYPAAVDVPDPQAESSTIDQAITGSSYTPHNTTQYGSKSNLYGNTNLPAFLCQRTGQVLNPLPDQSYERLDIFEAQEETAYVDIPPGYYSKVKFCQIVNDAFNLIQGSLTNTDKPLETFTVPQPATYYDYVVTPVDYQLNPNSISPLLKAYEYKYDTAKVMAADPHSISSETKMYINDLTWPYWFIPTFTVPSDPAYYVAENIYPPYVWYNSEQTGFLAGCSKFNLNYDTSNDLFYIDYTHTPILDTEQREVVLFSKALINYSQYSNTGYKANGCMGGILISRLFSYAYDDNGNAIPKNTNFWQDMLGFGFDDAYQTQFKADMITKSNTFYNNYRLAGSQQPEKYGITYTFTSTHPDPKYLQTSTTNALIPIQWLQQSNFAIATADKGMSIFSKDIPKIFQSIGSRVIYGDNAGYVKPNAYYLIDINISHLKNDNYRDRDSFRQIMSIAGKTYNSGTSYIQLFGDNSIQALNLTEDIYIDKIEVKILNPDKTLATGLGDTTTIFLRIIQPVIMEQNKIK